MAEEWIRVVIRIHLLLCLVEILSLRELILIEEMGDVFVLPWWRIEGMIRVILQGKVD